MNAFKAARRAESQALRDLPRGEVAGRGVQDLALVHEVVERAQRLLERRVVIEAVQVEHVDAIGRKTTKTGLDGANQVQARRTACVRVLARREVRLAGDHHLVPLIGDEAAEDLLGAAPVVDVGGIEDVDPGVARRAELRRRRGLVGIAAERHRPQAES